VVTEIFAEFDEDDPSGGSINFVGQVVDTNGKVQGNWERYLYTGSMEINNDTFWLNPKKQGNGFGGRFYYHSEHELAKMGVKKITLETGLEVGGYAWARVGFDFADREDAAYLSDGFRDYWKEKTGDPFPYKKKLLTPWEIASTTGSNKKVNLGKQFLLGDQWSGVKKLDENSIGFQVGEAYYKLKGYK
jgi:hypothetical protein